MQQKVTGARHGGGDTLKHVRAAAGEDDEPFEMADTADELAAIVHVWEYRCAQRGDVHLRQFHGSSRPFAAPINNRRNRLAHIPVVCAGRAWE